MEPLDIARVQSCGSYAAELELDNREDDEDGLSRDAQSPAEAQAANEGSERILQSSGVIFANFSETSTLLRPPKFRHGSPCAHKL